MWNLESVIKNFFKGRKAYIFSDFEWHILDDSNKY